MSWYDYPWIIKISFFSWVLLWNSIFFRWNIIVEKSRFYHRPFFNILWTSERVVILIVVSLGLLKFPSLVGSYYEIPYFLDGTLEHSVLIDENNQMVYDLAQNTAVPFDVWNSYYTPLFSVTRYLENRIRDNIDLTGTPIILQFKNKSEK